MCMVILHRTFNFISATLFTIAKHIAITEIGLAFLHASLKTGKKHKYLKGNA